MPRAALNQPPADSAVWAAQRRRTGRQRWATQGSPGVERGTGLTSRTHDSPWDGRVSSRRGGSSSRVAETANENRWEMGLARGAGGAFSGRPSSGRRGRPAGALRCLNSTPGAWARGQSWLPTLDRGPQRRLGRPDRGAGTLQRSGARRELGPHLPARTGLRRLRASENERAHRAARTAWRLRAASWSRLPCGARRCGGRLC